MQDMTDIETAARRKRAHKTAMIAGAFAIAVFLLSIVQMLKV